MKVALVYPPDRCLPTIPYSALAQLAAVLRAAGHDVMLRDLNAEVFWWLNQAERLGAYYDHGCELVARFEQKERLTEEERRLYDYVAPIVAAPRESLTGAPEAAAVFRDPERFFQPELFNQAFDRLETMIRFVYSANPVFDPENRFFVTQNVEAVERPLGDPVTDAYGAGMLDALLAEQPDVIGFTLPFSFQFFEMLKVARLIKERAPEVRIVVGGPTINDYATRLFESAELFRYIDFAVAGEGERAVVGLVNALAGDGNLEQVPNLIWCEDGKVRRSLQPPDVPDLNEFPAPDFRGIPFEQYLAPARIANLQTSRGCYYGKCTFCGDGFRRNFRMRAPDLIYQDIKQIHQDSGVDYFLFWDSLAPPKTLRHVARKIRENGDQIQWFAETKFEKPYTDPALVRTLSDGGCRFLQFGFESGSQRVLDLMDKGNDIERVDVILDHLRHSEIQAGVSWFIGFPTETPDEAVETYSFVMQRSDRIAMSVYAGTFMLGRDTLVYAAPERYGIRILEKDDGGVDFEMRDGTQHYDRTELDHAFRARGDLPLLNHGGYLLYAARHPERLRAITGMGRYGTVACFVEDIEAARPVLSAGIRLRTYKFNPFGRTAAERERPIEVAFYEKTGTHFPLTELDRAILEAVARRRTVGEIVAALEASLEENVEERIRLLVDRGILTLPGARARIPVLDPVATH